MFIRWRHYQRQAYGQKIDLHRMQPILMQSYRWTKKECRLATDAQGWTDEEFNTWWRDHGRHMKPRQRQVLRLPSFASCDYVYLDNPRHIGNRVMYWKMLDLIFERGALSSLPEKTKEKIKDGIDALLPRPWGQQLEIYEEAVAAGMFK